MEVLRNVSLAPLTTFNIGGPAAQFIAVESEGALLQALNYARQENIPFFIFAGGSNILVPDEGFPGLVIHMRIIERSQEGNTITLGAGNTLWAEIIDASRNGHGGWEQLAGIPGTVGGAVRGNAGAFGQEIKDVLISVRTINATDHSRKEFSPEECEFAYRTSIFKKKPEHIITSVKVALPVVGLKEATESVERTVAEREARHLQDVRAAGSFFMNPVAPPQVQELFRKEKKQEPREGRVPAGWLIEKVGMRGAKVNDAFASDQHSNYIINTGEATAADVIELAGNIKRAVNDQFSIILQEEAMYMRPLL